jgi:hypothetical protein
MILVAAPDVTTLNAFKDDPEAADLHPLRESGSKNYRWWPTTRPDDSAWRYGRDIPTSCGDASRH